jgi:hypothetical protein
MPIPSPLPRWVWSLVTPVAQEYKYLVCTVMAWSCSLLSSSSARLIMPCSYHWGALGRSGPNAAPLIVTTLPPSLGGYLLGPHAVRSSADCDAPSGALPWYVLLYMAPPCS